MSENEDDDEFERHSIDAYNAVVLDEVHGIRKRLKLFQECISL